MSRNGTYRQAMGEKSTWNHLAVKIKIGFKAVNEFENRPILLGIFKSTNKKQRREKKTLHVDGVK